MSPCARAIQGVVPRARGRLPPGDDIKLRYSEESSVHEFIESGSNYLRLKNKYPGPLNFRADEITLDLYDLRNSDLRYAKNQSGT